MNWDEEQLEAEELRNQAIRILLESNACWMCPECNTVNFFLNERCVYCWMREGKEVMRDDKTSPR